MAAVYTLAEAQETLRKWHEALDACRAGSFYTIAGRQVTRQDIPTIRAEIQRWHNTVLQLEARAQGKERPMGSIALMDDPYGGGGIIPDAVWRDYRT